MAGKLIPNSDITIYNRYTENRVEKYQRVEVYDIVWQATKAISGSRSGQLSSNVATVFIPFARGDEYVTPKNWLPDENTWTFQEGDIIVKGIAPEEITTEYQVTALRAQYDNVVMVTSVDTMDQGSPNMRHWQVGCK